MRICHIMSGDLWAGAEAQLATAASYLVDRPEVKLTVVVLNEGWLAGELRRLGVPVAVVAEREHNPLAIVIFLTRFFRDNGVDVIHTHRYKESILGTIFTGCLEEETRVGPYAAVVPTITGSAWITGISQYVLDAEDPFPDGFTVGDLWAGGRS